MLRRSEEQLRAADRLTRSVLDAVTEQAVIGTDLRGVIDVWNPGAEALLGRPAAEVQGLRRVEELFLPEEVDAWREQTGGGPDPFSVLVEPARAGADVREWTFVRADGSRLPVEVAITPRPGAEGQTVGYIFVAADMTRAQEAARLKDQFVGSISHELRTPVGSILGYLELLRDDPLTEEQLRYVGVAERNAHRLLRLVGDLLFTAQVEAGSFSLERTRVDLVEIVRGALESAGPAAAAAGVGLVAELPDGEVVLSADPVRLGQVCDNLLSNAIKFTPRDGTVTASVRPVEGAVLLSVRDTGLGIPAAELDQLFGRFFRASTATRNAVPGVGLGLTITRAIVVAYAGSVAAASEEGTGTAFTVTLPLD